MTSSVFYKFKNSREPERITFEGTGISVFELKHDIIKASGLGDGSDFDLHLYPEDQPTAEYDDDTTIISRSSTVIAVRRPAARGHGRAARYVSGRAPVRAIKKADAKPTITPTPGAALTEQDAEAAFLAESAQVWDAQKETLAHAKPVFHKKKPVNVPTHDPPPGYVCYRCQKKGHWIQACPTNDDPDFKPQPRAKRTTGIPRSFLKTVEKPVDEEDARGVMLNADGEYVQVMTDTRTWEKFQEKANASKAQAANVDAAHKEVRERGLECPIDKRMFVDPVKTPCCGKTYCHDCIENALADGDLVCPNCSKEGVLIDDLATDEDMVQQIKVYEAEKAKEKLDKEQQAKEEAQAAAKSPTPPNNKDDISVRPTGSTSPKPSNSSVSQSTSNVKSPLTVAANPTSSSTPGAGAGGNGSDTDTSTTSKKRKDPPTEIKPPTAPKAMRQQKEQQSRQAQDQQVAGTQGWIQDMEVLRNMPNMPPNIPNMPIMPNGNMPMSMSMSMPMNPMMMNAPNMNPQNMGGYPQGYNQGYPNTGWNQGYGNAPNNFNNMAYPPNNYQNMPNQNMPMHNANMNSYNNQGYGMNGSGWTQGYGNTSNQNFTEQDAYERKPVNPHRQNRHRKQRAPDFHYV
ncbi:DWNN-domain-containing protein [Trematosphaeria pertusa]|uniref:DWNN-domain-containing protein n=1 Tax=Trematosphaeria pertusa TaxID=390896 RepID=A0A6A6I3S3_9PLEO|nr:DWNN-domain-containing protein [Trematosphaeria pertusa]KAF2244917.1 DWNN-domain-containing protein [Trematosphaeria pertusa]